MSERDDSTGSEPPAHPRKTSLQQYTTLVPYVADLVLALMTMSESPATTVVRAGLLLVLVLLVYRPA
ncbi:hypothetical protein ACTG9Q_31555 [Actinokineospora sp. 24-640]